MERAAPLENPFAAPRVESPIAVVFEEEPAEPSQRLFAQLLDGALYVAVWIPALAAVFALYGGGDFDAGKLLLSFALVFPLFIVQAVMLGRTGQTIGKKALGVRVVRHADGGNPGFFKAVVLRYWLNAVLSMVPLFGGLYALIDPLLIFSRDRRCLHDHLAGTKVIKTR